MTITSNITARIATVTAAIALAGCAISPVAAFANTEAHDPGVKIAAATRISPTSATLHGAVDPDGHFTQYRFQYYVNSHWINATTTRNAGSGGRFESVSARLSNLQPGTKYTYRRVAQNSQGTIPTAGRTFVTTR